MDEQTSRKEGLKSHVNNGNCSEICVGQMKLPRAWQDTMTRSAWKKRRPGLSVKIIKYGGKNNQTITGQCKSTAISTTGAKKGSYAEILNNLEYVYKTKMADAGFYLINAFFQWSGSGIT